MNGGHHWRRESTPFGFGQYTLHYDTLPPHTWYTHAYTHTHFLLLHFAPKRPHYTWQRGNKAPPPVVCSSILPPAQERAVFKISISHILCISFHRSATSSTKTCSKVKEEDARHLLKCLHTLNPLPNKEGSEWEECKDAHTHIHLPYSGKFSNNR